jgi:hypothetical protein
MISVFAVVIVALTGIDWFLIRLVQRTVKSRVRFVFIGWIILISIFFLYFSFRIYEITTG